MKTLFLLLLSCLLALNFSAAATIPPHPRLLVTEADWKNLGNKMASNPIVKNIVATTISRADTTIDAPLLERTLTGRRLLSVSRDAIQYILDLSAAYKITGNRKYLNRACAELRNVCSFSDWNPEHHLDTAEMQTAVAIGYDWLYHDISLQDRKVIAAALLEKGLKTTIEYKSVLARGNNWNQVCNGGITFSSIALMELHPEISKTALELVRKGIPIALNEGYTPEGSYAEGGGYWSYGSEFSILTHEACRTAHLPDPGIKSHPGFLQSGDFLVQVYGTSNDLFNYGDNKESTLGPIPAVVWIARETQNANLLEMISPNFGKPSPQSLSRFHILAAFWYPAKTTTAIKKYPTHFTAAGISPIAIHRTGFQSSDLFLGIKAGKAKVNHGHMDAGSFVIDWQGQRWATDLGSQSYHSLEKLGFVLFDMKQDGDRWKAFRLNNFSHNTLTRNGKLHDIAGTATIISSTAHPEHKTVVDLSETLDLPKNATAIRTFQMNTTTNPPSITITDEISNLQPTEKITWHMLTSAKTTKTGDHQFLLSQNKKSATLILESARATSTSSPVIPPQPYDDIPKGYTSIHMTAQPDDSGKIVIKATFMPK